MLENDIMKSLKWAELAAIEDYLDTPMDEWAHAKSKARLSMAMQYILAKRTNPALTIEEAEQMTIQELIDLSGVELVDPKEAPQP